jgi:hypothetical protein
MKKWMFEFGGGGLIAIFCNLLFIHFLGAPFWYGLVATIFLCVIYAWVVDDIYRKVNSCYLRYLKSRPHIWTHRWRRAQDKSWMILHKPPYCEERFRRWWKNHRNLLKLSKKKIP